MRRSSTIVTAVVAAAAGVIATLAFQARNAAGRDTAAQISMSRDAASHDMASHGMSDAMPGDTVKIPDNPALPPDADHALARLNASPRHGQYVMIPKAGGDSMRAWIEYPERSTKAPVVIVVHEIFGMSTWVRGVADQLAKEGFIAIVPDFLSGQNLPGAPDSVPVQVGVAAVSKLQPADVQAGIDAAAKYGMALPSATHKYGVVGFCWGGGVAFSHAVHAPSLSAAVVYYGVSPDTASLRAVHAPVLGLYGANDARVVATIAPADSAMHKLGKTYEHRVFAGAAHGFLRAQPGAEGANYTATQQAWPATIDWFHKYLGK